LSTPTAADARPTLVASLPGPRERLTPDEILGRFLSYCEAIGLTLYPAQEEAIFELFAGKHVILNTPTGSGKSLVATAMFFKALCEGRKGFYTCPVKALVSEKFFAFCNVFGAENVGMMTGDATVNRRAPLICCTAEILSNMALRDPFARIDDVVMDEFHYYGDKDRGMAWQIPLIALKQTTFLLMSATLGDMTTIAKNLEDETGQEVAFIKKGDRPVPLTYSYAETPLHETIAELIKERKQPIYLVNFSQRAAAEEAQNLLSVDICTKEEKEALKVALKDAVFSTPFGKELSKFLRHGVGLHHAGLLPRYRLLVEKLAQTGLLKVVSGTDTLGVGVNIPIRTVLFTQLCKFDGEKSAILGVRDFQQIAGRAGRKGFDDQGWVVAQAPAHVIENKRLSAKGGKKFVPRKPPAKGYVPWDKGTFDRLVSGTPEPLTPRFAVSHGMLLNLLQARLATRGGGYRRLTDVIKRTHGGENDRKRYRRQAAAAFRTLRHAGLVNVVTTEKIDGRLVEVSQDLQKDFSLNQTLALYLLDTLPKLDRDSPTYALDVLSLVEAILEDPDMVLRKQLDRLKDEKVAEMKAAGVEYEQRMEELEKLEYPKPNREFTYETFNAFAEKHPWVGTENIRPKSVAREMIEYAATFGEYIREYGLERSEGVLLRYLSETYKTLVQSVPTSFWTEEVHDIAATLQTTLRRTDSSLLDEWEGLRRAEDGETERGAAAVGDGADEGEKNLATLVPIDKDPRAFAARIRAEMHALISHLAGRRFEDALAATLPNEEDAEPWTTARLERALSPFFATYAGIDTSPTARHPRNTVIRPRGDRDRVYVVEQRLIGKPVRGTGVRTPVISVKHAATAEEANDLGEDAHSSVDEVAIQGGLDAAESETWMLEAFVDLGSHPAGVRAGWNELPLLALARIGEP
jgi:superfamily II RNA helicase